MRVRGCQRIGIVLSVIWLLQNGSAMLCFLLVLLSSSELRAAQTDWQLNTTGNAFYALCTSQSTSYERCVFYVIGYTDGLHLANAFLEGTGHPKMFCMPSAGNSVLSSISGIQMVDTIMGFLQRYPQRRHELIPKLSTVRLT